ncbi:putative AraC family transcriptional regulator [Sphingobium herbicidovorans NBRC 16415]|uniref:AraC family transcriptional regulator n=1 Tax=Sphingobium herbicidovorans (strain ATCC 700291 / DSM 11019 / CCUG 56400 / KCTC 2939 / LMG 18315 / NBRC 16415 / MH) TaxID=1219045 RepID=A0A086P643_SPHHM|nr:helix-turn-helix domain-containing protein [Sphingobium herbicidovorans]KFG88861.1 putative AraC family transcriptional regulator [Sphingobium herbicidovorans NBRC 16415]
MAQQALIDPQGEAGHQVAGRWTVLAVAVSSAARVELRRYELPSPNEMWELDDAPILSIVMPRAEGTQGEIMFDLGDRRRHKVGRLLLRPGGIAMHSRGDGGMLDILTCRFDPVRFAAATGLSDWDSHRLSCCASINSPMLMTLAERLKQETVAPEFGSDMAVEALVELLMVELARLFGRLRQRDAGQGGLAPWQLARIDEVLRATDGVWPTTQALANLCGISRSHLSRSFAATTGVALSDHAAAIRLERAQDMIRGGLLPMNRIAETLGFATASAFSAAFRRATGLTPRAFRQSFH